MNATPASATQVQLTWSDNANNETGFRIERRSGAGSFATVGSAGANTTSFSDPGLTSGISYTYRVCAVNAAGDSAFSNEASATPAAARANINSFPSVTAALQSGQPLYAPSGTYNLPANFRPTVDIDILGDVANAAARPVFNVPATGFLPEDDVSIRLQGIKFQGGAGRDGKLLFIASGEVFDMAGLTVLDASFDRCTPIQWGVHPSVTTQILRRLELRRFTVTNALRGVFANGRIDDFLITDFEVTDCDRFGIAIGPTGGDEINAPIKDQMLSGYVGQGVVRRTLALDGTNSAQLYIAGTNVGVEDVQLLDMRYPAAYYSNPSSTPPSDSEPFYTKVDGLIVSDVLIRNDGGNQGMWGLKGATGARGRDTQAYRVTFANRRADGTFGTRRSNPIWLQVEGPTVLEDCISIGRTWPAIIIQNSATGPLTIIDWVEQNENTPAGQEDIRRDTPNVSINRVNSPSLSVIEDNC